MRRRRLWFEVFWVYLGVCGAIKLMYDLRFLAVIHQALWTAAMLLQVYVPAWLVSRRGQMLSDLGLHWRRWPRSVGLWAGVSLVVLPPSVIGHHGWQSFLGHRLELSGVSLRQLPLSLQGPPPAPSSNDIIQIYTLSQAPIVYLRWQSPLQGIVESDGEIRVSEGGHHLQGPPSGKRLLLDTKDADTLRLHLSGTRLAFQLRRGEAPIQGDRLQIGPQGESLTEGRIDLDLSWLWTLILIQLLMVALPEEVFYRGYLLPRLEALYPQTLRFGPVSLTLGNVVTSLLFALTHFAIGYQAYRLSVFFPSLLFGLLRTWGGGSLLAPILVHASANLWMRLLEMAYR